MPFDKKSRPQDSMASLTNISSLFIGRTDELLFFVHNILQPESPTHNILSISGQGGVGKSTLLARFIDEASSANFKDYCLTAIVDERQTTPVRIMEKFAQQLHITGEFEKVLKQYKGALRRQQTEQETLQERFFESVPDIAGAAFEGIPFAGSLLREGAKVTARHFLKKDQTSQGEQDTMFLDSIVDELTKAFVTELNHLADTKVTISSSRKKRQQRIVLFFDTFEQLATEATPWLLDHFLDALVSCNVVLVIAGRDPIEHTSSNDPKRWLPFCDDGTIYWISLNSFTEDETHMYLVKRGITDADQLANIWHLSRGLPLYLGLLTSNPHGDIDPTKDVVVNFLRWIPEREHIKRQLALDAALFSRPFNQDDLEVFSYVPEPDRVSLYEWLTEQPFVRSMAQDGRYLYHDVARDLFSHHLYQRSQKDYYEIRRALVTHYRELLEKIQLERGQEVYGSEEWLELLLAIVFQLLLLPDQASHIKAIEYALLAYEHSSSEQEREIVRVLRDLAQEPSSHHISPAARLVVMQLLHYIEAYRNKQEWLAAVDALIEKVIHVPSFPTEITAYIYRSRGLAYKFLGKKELASENFQQALKLFNSTDYFNRGLAHLYSGNYTEALIIHEQAIEQNPRDAPAYFGRGWAYINLGEYQQAIADFEYVLELEPNYIKLNPGGLYNGYRHAYYGAGKYQQAISANDYCLEQDEYTYYIFRSKCFRSLKDYQQSINMCNHALELAPEEASAYFQRGLTYLWLKDIGQAHTDFIRSCEIKQTGIYYILIAKWVRMCLEAVDANILEQLETIKVGNTQRYTAHVCQGIALLLRRHFKESLAELDQACLPKYNNEWEAYFWKGMAHAFLGQEEEAIAAVEKSLELGLPPVLLAPLRWFEQERPDFYEKYVIPLLAKYA
jgi:tetratricopeptide (TPR) repeat protein